MATKLSGKCKERSLVCQSMPTEKFWADYAAFLALRCRSGAVSAGSRVVTYDVGEQLLLNTKNVRWEGPGTPELMLRWTGPYQVL